ncbi:hypothetical protein OAB57_01985 [Bacteriovoracaceae bacterium]|nr:hypothetical protein [Bacteriovoracaceae bacterium]
MIEKLYVVFCLLTSIYASSAFSLDLINIRSKSTPSEKLAIQACIGLYNGKYGGSVFATRNNQYPEWPKSMNFEGSSLVEDVSFLKDCLREFPRCIRYSYAKQQKLIPNIITVGAVLEAIPLDEKMDNACNEVVFDANVEFKRRNTPYLATKYVYEKFVNRTTGLAMFNPGYGTKSERVWKPGIVRDVNSSLVDFIYSRKLFAIFLVNGCIKVTKEHGLLNRITVKNPWEKPIAVYGYNNSWNVFGGFLFEAQTKCNRSRNMGAVPTDGVTNLSYFSTRRSPINNIHEIRQNKVGKFKYDRKKTYVAFVVGDGDNISYIMSSRRRWFLERLSMCPENNSCPPLTWTISPHLLHLAPDVLDWYYDIAKKTGNDFFMLPPSGHLYAYPSSMKKDAQDRFIELTERDARLLGTKSTMNWEWWTSWRRAEKRVLRKYAKKNGVIGGVFPVNVPFMFPTFTWKKDQFHKILIGDDGGKVVLFRPRQWRGIHGKGNSITKNFFLTPKDMASELSKYPRGTVSYVYMTSDGGLNLKNSFMTMAKLLPKHVQLVSADKAIELALAASSAK